MDDGIALRVLQAALVAFAELQPRKERLAFLNRMSVLLDDSGPAPIANPASRKAAAEWWRLKLPVLMGR